MYILGFNNKLVYVSIYLVTVVLWKFRIYHFRKFEEAFSICLTFVSYECDAFARCFFELEKHLFWYTRIQMWIDISLIWNCLVMSYWLSRYVRMYINAIFNWVISIRISLIKIPWALYICETLSLLDTVSAKSLLIWVTSYIR